MAPPDKTPRPPPPKKPPPQVPVQAQNLPSPALCCACGLCIMLAGINITLVGAFAFGSLVPAGNPPIIIGPLLLLVAVAFFAACCVGSKRPPSGAARASKGGETWGLMQMGAVEFEMETSEHTLQDTTAMQVSPTNSPSCSNKSVLSQGGDAEQAPGQPAAQDVAVETTSEGTEGDPNRSRPAENHTPT